MKNKVLIVVLGLLSGVAFGQTDQQNLDKYWKFRASFKKNFIRIGTEQGESLPMGRRGFGKCQDTDDYNATLYGQLYWGDGVIRHGHYLGFLATEYALLKRSGQDVTATLNELYYALNAFNRLDYLAEFIISENFDNLAQQQPSLNGYFLRDDVPEWFDLPWKDEPIQARGVSGDIFVNNNSDHLHAGTAFRSSYETGQWSNPSLDQMTSLLVGLKVCDKLIPENLWVKPTANDSVMNLADEIRQITNRIITNVKDHNWYMINMHGWPVGNGGGNLLFTAHPIAEIGNQITGIDYTSNMRRSVTLAYKNAAIFSSKRNTNRKRYIFTNLICVSNTKYW